MLCICDLLWVVCVFCDFALWLRCLDRACDVEGLWFGVGGVVFGVLSLQFGLFCWVLRCVVFVFSYAVYMCVEAFIAVCGLKV